MGDKLDAQSEEVVHYTAKFPTKSKETVLATDFVQDKKESKAYLLPNPVALDTSGFDLTYYLNNALQKQVFKKLSELTVEVLKKEDEVLANDLLRLGSAHHFRQMGNHIAEDERYAYYMSMINCLADLELRAD